MQPAGNEASAALWGGSYPLVDVLLGRRPMHLREPANS